MICAVCHEPLEYDGPMGYVHDTGSMYAPDGHAVVPINDPAQPWYTGREERNALN